MRFFLTLAVFFGLMISNSYADLLRVSTLSDPFSETLDGSLYYKDKSNIFHNPSELAYYNTSSLYFQEGEAGVFKRNGSTIYGVYYGREDRDFATIRDEMGGFSSISTSKNNPLQLFFSRRSRSAAWGASLSYLNESAKASSSAEEENISLIKGSLGYTKKKYDLFLNYASVSGANSLASQEEFEGGLNILAGWKFKYKSYRAFLVYKKNDFSISESGASTDTATNDILAGMGKRLNSQKLGLDYYYSFNLLYSKRTDESTSTSTETTEYALPLQLGLEYDVTSWFKLRAGANYFFLRSLETTGDVEQTETGAVINGPKLGGTFTYQNMELDFLYNSGFDQSATGNGGVEKVGEVALTVKW